MPKAASLAVAACRPAEMTKWRLKSSRPPRVVPSQPLARPCMRRLQGDADLVAEVGVAAVEREGVERGAHLLARVGAGALGLARGDAHRLVEVGEERAVAGQLPAPDRLVEMPELDVDLIARGAAGGVEGAGAQAVEEGLAADGVEVEDHGGARRVEADGGDGGEGLAAEAVAELAVEGEAQARAGEGGRDRQAADARRGEAQAVARRRRRRGGG